MSQPKSNQPFAFPEEFKLTEAELHSALWQRIETHLKNRLATFRILNDVFCLEQQTIATRGRISMIKELLALNGENK